MSDEDVDLTPAEIQTAIAALPAAPKCQLTDRVAALEALIAKIEPLLPPDIEARLKTVEVGIAALEEGIAAIREVLPAGVVAEAGGAVKALEGRFGKLALAIEKHFGIKS